MAPILSTMNVQPQIPVDYRKNNQQQSPNFTSSTTGNPSADKIVSSNPLLSAASSAPENPSSFLLQAAVAFAALFGINNFINNPLITKNYNDTIFKKIETAGDAFGQKPFMQKVQSWAGIATTKAKNLVNKSEILRTLFHKPSLGGSQVMGQAAGTNGHLANRALEIMKKYKEANPAFNGFDAIISKAGKDSYKYYDEIMQTIRNSGADLTKVISKKPWWGFGIVKNKVSLQEVLNKDILIQNYKGAGKTLGQKLSGYLMRGTESLTNGLFSGKGQVLIQALMVAQSLNEASKAEKGEKGKVFAASLAELMAFMATMGIQQRAVNHLAGLKYIGFTPTNVAQYKDAIRLANEAAKAGNHAAYATNVTLAKNLKKLANLNTKWYQKPIKWLGNIISYGRIKETIKPLKTNAVTNIFSKIPYGLKVGLGYAGRVALIMGVIIPIFSGIAKKASYAIFGKPVKTIEKEKQKEREEEQRMQQEQAEYEKQLAQAQQPSSPVQPVQPSQPAQQPAFTQQQYPPQPVKQGDLVQKMQNMHNSNPASQPLASQPMAQSQPIASAPIQQSPDAGIKRTYVPNPILGVENTPVISESRNARIDKVMRQADIAEMQAGKYL